jgi:Asp-tRNA(Asn)/Glu-tRNA(Gln) amidotransferase A subunit family amidase
LDGPLALVASQRHGPHHWDVALGLGLGCGLRPVDPEITAAVAAAATQLADLGYEVEEVTLPFVGNAFGALATFVYGEIVPCIKALTDR